MAMALGWGGGEAAGAAIPPGGSAALRRRRRTLDGGRAARIRDLIYLLLVDDSGLSPADAELVLSAPWPSSRQGRNDRLRPARSALSGVQGGALAALLAEVGAAADDAGDGWPS
jgi:hypothetical protein